MDHHDPAVDAHCLVGKQAAELVGLVAICFGFLGFVDYYLYTMQTLAIISVCALMCVLLGVPIGVLMSRNDRVQQAMIPILDMLQTLPPFVYQNLLDELQGELQKTVVFITHDLDEALKLADHLVILKDGLVVQQAEPQHILLHPADPYIEDFVSDINRARVLRVRSVMIEAAESPEESTGEIDHDDTLESVIALSEGDTALSYRVMKNGKVVGVLEMRKLVCALVPAQQSDERESARLT